MDNAIRGRGTHGTVIIPAYNEAGVIDRLLASLSPAALEGSIEVIVVCNGCTDATADHARRFPGIQVVELVKGSKTGALNAGDARASSWPRLYLDADVQISVNAILAVLNRVSQGDVLVACPRAVHNSEGASGVVRSYYRARERISIHHSAVWQAGAYALSRAAHERFGHFPDITGDDYFIDATFFGSEKVVMTQISTVRKTPRTSRDLVAIMRRHRRGNVEVLDRMGRSDGFARDTSKETALAVLATVRGPRTASDAFVYLMLSAAARLGPRRSAIWERDQSSRSVDRPS